jgi:hypothetical protein
VCRFAALCTALAATADESARRRPSLSKRFTLAAWALDCLRLRFERLDKKFAAYQKLVLQGNNRASQAMKLCQAFILAGMAELISYVIQRLDFIYTKHLKTSMILAV